MRSRLRVAAAPAAIVLCTLLTLVVTAPAAATAAPMPAAPHDVTTTVPPSSGSGVTSTSTASTTSTTSTTSPAATSTSTTPSSAPPSATTTTGPTSTTVAPTTTTTLDPQALANLIQGLDGDVAQAEAVNDYLAATAVATTAGTGQPPPTGADPVLVQAAAAQLQANADQAAANDRYAAARRGLAQVALDLYVGDQPPNAGAAIVNSPADRTAFLDGILNSEDQKAKLAKVQLAQADAAIQRSREAADRLVQNRTTQLQAIALQAASAANAAAAAAASTATTAAASPGRPAIPAGTPGVAATPVGAGVPSLLSDESPSILGPSVLTAGEMSGWFRASGRQANLTVPIDQLVADYQSVGSASGVRPDIAFAQSVVETGYFDFPSWGQVAVGDNNFAGIGACDSCSTGFRFPDALTGVQAQMQLLHAYATTSQPFPGPLPGPFSVAGCCQTWMALSGVWATNPAYGVEILTVYRSMVDWALTQRRAAAHL
ncbi:MAG TPA: glucosaminidase domain-containing protein [Acidimicrobiales bacterium]|jgi:hypothetical protein|nr:glucosaminidase domain-containing protein [Acidimicrobiales bacterium]